MKQFFLYYLIFKIYIFLICSYKILNKGIHDRKLIINHESKNGRLTKKLNFGSKKILLKSKIKNEKKTINFNRKTKKMKQLQNPNNIKNQKSDDQHKFCQSKTKPKNNFKITKRKIKPSKKNVKIIQNFFDKKSTKIKDKAPKQLNLQYISKSLIDIEKEEPKKSPKIITRKTNNKLSQQENETHLETNYRKTEFNMKYTRHSPDLLSLKSKKRNCTRTSFSLTISSESFSNSFSKSHFHSQKSHKSEISNLTFNSTRKSQNSEKNFFKHSNRFETPDSKSGVKRKLSVNLERQSDTTESCISHQINRFFDLCQQFNLSSENNESEILGKISNFWPSAAQSEVASSHCSVKNSFLKKLCTINEELSIELENEKRLSLFSRH